MKRLGSFLKLTVKWGSILAVIYAGSQYLAGIDFQTRIGWFIACLAMSIAYVDGSLKDRISFLEARVDELNRRLNGYR